jgi:hypothetical protein
LAKNCGTAFNGKLLFNCYQPVPFEKINAAYSLHGISYAVFKLEKIVAG